MQQFIMQYKTVMLLCCDVQKFLFYFYFYFYTWVQCFSVQMSSICQRLIIVPVDPLRWSFDMAEMWSFGAITTIFAKAEHKLYDFV